MSKLVVLLIALLVVGSDAYVGRAHAGMNCSPFSRFRTMTLDRLAPGTRLQAHQALAVTRVPERYRYTNLFVENKGLLDADALSRYSEAQDPSSLHAQVLTSRNSFLGDTRYPKGMSLRVQDVRLQSGTSGKYDLNLMDETDPDIKRATLNSGGTTPGIRTSHGIGYWTEQVVAVGLLSMAGLTPGPFSDSATSRRAIENELNNAANWDAIARMNVSGRNHGAEPVTIGEFLDLISSHFQATRICVLE